MLFLCLLPTQPYLCFAPCAIRTFPSCSPGPCRMWPQRSLFFVDTMVRVPMVTVFMQIQRRCNREERRVKRPVTALIEGQGENWTGGQTRRPGSQGSIGPVGGIPGAPENPITCPASAPGTLVRFQKAQGSTEVRWHTSEPCLTVSRL